jgi:hypothetical protein
MRPTPGAGAGDGAATIPLWHQPLPTDLNVSYLRHGRGWITTIMRGWDDPSRCRLCDECHANARGCCCVVVDEYVPPESTALFSTRGRPVQGAARLRVERRAH